MKISIIGSGNVGSALATSFGTAGYEATKTTRGNEAAAVAGADAVVLAVPWSSFDDVAASIAPA